MKKLLFLSLVFVLAACAPATPQTVVVVVTSTPAPQVATDTPVPVVPTDTPAPTATTASTDTPAPVVPTDTPAAAGPTDTAMPADTATATEPPAVGAAVFTNFTRSQDKLSLKCSPGDVTFGITAIDTHIKTAYVAYRMEDQQTHTMSPWSAPIQMTGDGKGNYTIDFSALQINPDYRYATAVMYYQFIGLNQYTNVVGRSDKFQMPFTLDCPQ